MKSSQQRRAEIATKRQAHRDTEAAEQSSAQKARWEREAAGGVLVDSSKLAADGSASVPEFVGRGYYMDEPFACQECGREEIWTATQQKWWYEVAKGSVWTTARLCRPCRRDARERRSEARRIHLDGIALKQKHNTQS